MRLNGTYPKAHLAARRNENGGMNVDEASIIQYITSTFDGIETVTSKGNTFIFYGPDRKMPLATIVTTDEYAGFPDLDRPSVFRLNIGISKSTYRSLFGPEATHPDAASDGAGRHNFTALDHVIPHPIYGRTNWVCVLNPSATTFGTDVRPLIAEAVSLAAGRPDRRAARRLD
jgi:hypothetical protein